jgi:UDP-N-acetylglucosamine transferase subunit ALG13
VPRRRQFGEHLNDHQVDFARALADRGWVQFLSDPLGLGPAIERAARMSLRPVPDEPRLAVAIREQLNAWFTEDPDRGSGRTARSARRRNPS